MEVPRSPAQASALPPGSTPADPWFVLAALLTVAVATAEEHFERVGASRRGEGCVCGGVLSRILFYNEDGVSVSPLSLSLSLAPSWEQLHFF